MRQIYPLLAAATLSVLGTLSFAQNGRLILDEAPLDKAVDIPKEKLAAYYAKMSKEQIGVIRMLEGGLYNVNIRHVENADAGSSTARSSTRTRSTCGSLHEGGGTLVTGGEEVDGKHRGGVERQVKSATSSSSRPASTTA